MEQRGRRMFAWWLIQHKIQLEKAAVVVNLDVRTVLCRTDICSFVEFWLDFHCIFYDFNFVKYYFLCPSLPMEFIQETETYFSK